MKIKYLIGLFFVSLSFAAVGQENYFYINWDVNMPLSNTDWIGNTSARGAKVGYRMFIGRERRFSGGIDFNWAQFDEYKPKETFETETGAITTDYFNYVRQYAATISGQYYFPLGEKERIFPYVGLGLGANRNEYLVYYNIYTEGDKAWGFLARPEAGILVRIGTRRRMGLMAAVHYDYSTNKTDSYNYSNFSAVGFQLGIMSLQW